MQHANEYRYQTIAAWVCEQANGASRQETATAFGLSKSAATYHLDKCVSRGLLARTYTWTHGTSRGWVYFKPIDISQSTGAENGA